MNPFSNAQPVPDNTVPPLAPVSDGTPVQTDTTAGLAGIPVQPPVPPTLSLPTLTDAMKAARSWQAAMRRKSKPCIAAPWDENLLCLNPVITIIDVQASGSTKVASANPQRIGLIFSNAISGAQPIYLSPGKTFNPLNPYGIQITGNMSPFTITQRDWLNLASIEWYGVAVGGPIKLAVVEVILRDWPGG